MKWQDAPGVLETAEKLWRSGAAAGDIARRVGAPSRSAIIGVAKRRKWGPHPGGHGGGPAVNGRARQAKKALSFNLDDGEKPRPIICGVSAAPITPEPRKSFRKQARHFIAWRERRALAPIRRPGEDNAIGLVL